MKARLLQITPHEQDTQSGFLTHAPVRQRVPAGAVTLIERPAAHGTLRLIQTKGKGHRYVRIQSVRFQRQKTAGKAFEALDDHTPAYPWIDDAAVVSRNKFGFIRIHSTWAQDDSAVGIGTGFGALTGALLGMLLGPGRALAGAATGGSLGALYSASATRSPLTTRG